MNSPVQPYPQLWYRHRAHKKQRLEKARRQLVAQVKTALDTLGRRYRWDEAYLFGSITRPHRFGPASDVDVALCGLNPLDHYAFVGDISALLNRNVDVVRLEECPFASTIVNKGVKWVRKQH